MKFGYIADLHLSGYTQDPIQNNLPQRLHSLRTAIYHMANYCLNKKIDTIIIGGDSLHGKSIIYAIAQDVLVNFFTEFKTIHFIVIDGNHDLSGKGVDAVSALSSLRHIQNVTLVSKIPQSFDDIVCIPYCINILEQVKDHRGKILVSHFGLNEGLLNSGISIVSDVKLTDLIGRYSLVLLGHYHKPQQIIHNQLTLYYVGSPIQLDWGEKSEEKRFLIVDSNTLYVESIPTVGYKKYMEFILTKENKQEVIAQAKQLQDEGHYVKIIRNINIDVQELQDQFRIIDKVEKDITNRGITSSMSKEEKLDRYLDIKEIQEKELYKTVAVSIIDTAEGVY
jgi:DNA repair exonuclease SbcCD nuclease subunit